MSDAAIVSSSKNSGSFGTKITRKASARMFREVGTLLVITHQIGLRLKNVLRKTPEDVLPDSDWGESYKRYSDSLKWCMAEERARRKAVAEHGAEGLEAIEESAELVSVVDLLTDDEWDEAMRRRAAKAVK